MIHVKRLKKYNRNSQGFTIIETLVAIFILLVSTVGPLTFVQSGLRSSFMARDQIVAFYLAQDAIETIKNIVDQTYLDFIETPSTPPSSWLVGIFGCNPGIPLTTTAKCNITTGENTITFVPCSGPTCDPLKYDSTTKQFKISGGSDSKYTRTLYITEIVAGRELQINAHIKWDTNFFGEKEIWVQENIYKKY